jgi:sulfane dehydrogenase subunit SoxC
MGGSISLDELRLAARNHGMPLEALRYDVTPAGLHYLLIHYDIPSVDEARWRLEIGGAVGEPRRLDLAEIRSRPPATAAVTLECAGNGRALLEPRAVSQPWLVEAVGTAEWTGTPLAPLLAEAGVVADAVDVVFGALDRGIEGGVEQTYERSLPVAEAMRQEVLLAYEMNGRPLPPQHGYPLRLVVPGWYGMAHVKWLDRITVRREPFTGYQNARGYRWRVDEDEVGEPLTRIAPRALMIPPGIPEFMTRSRLVDAGEVQLRGRAWSGTGSVERVEVSHDAGETWSEAELGEPPATPFAWRSWSARWDARPGDQVLCCRATDSSGATQPLEPRWNAGGYANNAVQRVPVTVR